MSERSDFNDLAAERGLGAVRESIAAAAPVAEAEPGHSAPSSSRGYSYPLSEDALAASFEAAYAGKVRYDHARRKWYRYDAGLYREDSTELVAHYVREWVRANNPGGSAKWGKAAVVGAVEKLARACPALALAGDEFDSDPNIIGTPGGVFDLRTGKHLADDPARLVSMSASVTPDAAVQIPRWLKFLLEASGGNHDVVDYVQRLLGYCCTGYTREEHLTFMHGPGGNGKGVLLHVVRAVLGQYCGVAAMDTFLESRGDRHPADLADLVGRRVVIASESSEGRRWDEQRVKGLTGRDPITARFMRGNFFTFEPQFKLLVASNHKPRIRTVDDAWRRRLHLLPYENKPERPDPHLKERLEEELPGIFAWMLEGAEWWYREGLAAPDVITEATAAYFTEEDITGLWFAECCDAGPDYRVERSILYRSFERWCADMGHRAPTQHALTRWMKARGFGQDMGKPSRPYLGVELKALAP